ncbi:MAG TPA: hypothetical protein VJ642_04970 [Chromobacteriaceae bacterium]|nr:hypothetical protein [Chromobacteriaceae bacterium]
MLAALLKWLGMDGSTRRHNEQVVAAIEKVIDGTDPRLRLLPGYRSQLSKGMKTSLAYIAGIPSHLPSPLELSLRAFTTDKRIGLLFSSPLSLLLFLRDSQNLSEFFLNASNGDEAWGLLSMHRSETRRFGMSEENGEILSDVPQVVVSFDNHQLLLTCPSSAALQSTMTRRCLDVLIEAMVRRLHLLDRSRVELEGERSHILLKLNALTTPGSQVIDATANLASLPETAEELQQRLREVEQQLAELRPLSELTGVLDLVRHMLEHPRDYFRVEAFTLYLNRMGIKLDNPDDAEANALGFEEVILGQTEPIRRAVLPVHIPRTARQELEEQFGEELAGALNISPFGI